MATTVPESAQETGGATHQTTQAGIPGRAGVRTLKELGRSYLPSPRRPIAAWHCTSHDVRAWAIFVAKMGRTWRLGGLRKRTSHRRITELGQDKLGPGIIAAPKSCSPDVLFQHPRLISTPK